jgi:4-hydroxy-3-methylbut-2-enyl diphosphate reductase
VEIIVATYSGFCEGVSQAFNIAQSLTQKEQVFMLGDLVHNSEVVNQLKNKGIATVKSLEDIPKSTTTQPITIIISAHGVGPSVYEEARARNLTIIDTTCPWVKKAQKLAEKAAKNGRTVIIIGEKGHPEVKGLKEWGEPNSIVIENKAEAQLLDLGGPADIISQTTQSREKVKEITSILRDKIADLKENDTICGATNKRQQSALDLVNKVDGLIVVGDKKSANTKRLYELCLEKQPKTIWIQTASELDLQLIKGANKIGITAGASTPEWTIDAVIKKINENK